MDLTTAFEFLDRVEQTFRLVHADEAFSPFEFVAHNAFSWMLDQKASRDRPVHHGLETDHRQSRGSLTPFDRDQAPLLLRLGFASRLAVGNIDPAPKFPPSIRRICSPFFLVYG